MNQLPLLIADDALVTLLKIGFFLLLLVGPLILKAITGGKENANQQRPQARPQRPEVGAGGAGGAGAGANRPGQNKPLRAEVEEFLKRAKQQDQQQRPQQGAGRARGPVKVQPIGPPQPSAVLEAEVIDAPRRGSLVEHVDRHMAPRPDPQQQPPLARQIDQADENLESHLRDTFSHDLSNFKSDDNSMVAISQGTDADVWRTFDPDAPVAPAGPTLASEIADMLRDPRGMRKAVVLSEILNPPKDRWE